jgi:hypothetical protein
MHCAVNKADKLILRPAGLAGLFRDLFVPVPSTIVEIEPSWRGYDCFLVGDQT